MPEDPIHNPHDKLFKAGFSNPQTAAGLLREELPAEISAEIQWDHLKLEPGTFIDSHYRHSESDLLFSAPFEHSHCLLYILFEHQIAEDKLIALRLLRYMVRIWEDLLKKNPDPKKLPVIFPVVLAQNDKAWTLAPRFSAILDLPADLREHLLPHIPDFNFRLIQLSEIPFEAIRGTPSGIMILRTMKAERLAELLSDPVWDEALLIQLPTETLELLIRYMLGHDLDINAFHHRVHAIQQPQLRTSAMTLEEKIHAAGMEKGMKRGMEKGMERGMKKGLKRLILQTLEIRFGTLPHGLVEAVETIQSEQRLTSLHRTALQAPSLVAFSESL